MEIANIIGTWACFVSASACAIVIWVHISFQRRAYKGTEASLRGLNDAYQEMYKAINDDLMGFDRRIRALEER